ALLNKPILSASIGDIENMYVGKGSENVRAMFRLATESGALIFFDEAENVLSKRVPVTHSADQALNSIKSSFLVELPHHAGPVIFATNRVQEYDDAFQQRMLTIQLLPPDLEARCKLWQEHLKKAPLADDVCFAELASLADFTGRDIYMAAARAATIAR